MDRIAEIERRLDRARQPLIDMCYFAELKWDKDKFHLHAEEDVAYLLDEVRRLRLELGLSKPLYSRRQLLERAEAAEAECIEQARLIGMGAERELALMTRAEAAEALALDLADEMNLCRRNPNRTLEMHGVVADHVATMALSDKRLAKLREKKNG